MSVDIRGTTGITAPGFSGDGAGLSGVVISGVVTSDSNQICKAWVNFKGNGAVAIRDSFNVSSITDNGTGDYTANFTTYMSNTNYSIAANCTYLMGVTRRHRIISGYVWGTNSIRVISGHNDTAASDHEAVQVQIFGN